MTSLPGIECVTTSVKEFLLTEQRCPPEWRPFDLYLVRDDAVVFYVGQSYVAFDRVWRHILDGYKGRSVVGRFIHCNWPASMRFTIELLSSRSPQFADLGHAASLLRPAGPAHYLPAQSHQADQPGQNGHAGRQAPRLGASRGRLTRVKA